MHALALLHIIQLPYFYLLNAALEYGCVVGAAALAADNGFDGAGRLLTVSLLRGTIVKRTEYC